MKNLALILSATSLTISATLCYGAYVTYQRAQKILDNPEEFVGAVVEKQVNKAFENLSIPGIKGGVLELGSLNKGSIKFPF